MLRAIRRQMFKNNIGMFIIMLFNSKCGQIEIVENNIKFCKGIFNAFIFN